MAIEYFTIPELGEDRPLFRCEALRATMQVSSCKERWEQANAKNAPERLDRCRGCTIGAAHAGVGDATSSPLFSSGICSRCHRKGLRLVGNDKCVSCWNREREYLLGRNAKGAEPKLHPRLVRLEATVMIGKRVATVKRERAVDMTEVVVARLRDESKRVLFAFSSKALSGWAQQELFL